MVWPIMGKQWRNLRSGCPASQRRERREIVCGLAPSMRRPVSVKSFPSFFSLFLFSFFLLSVSFLLFPDCSHEAEPPLSPPFHPHSWWSDGRSVPVGCTRFSRCCYLISALCFPPAREAWARS